MRPDPLMDLLLLAAILLGAIVMFVFLWLLMRKYGTGSGLERRIEEASALQLQSSTVSTRQARHGGKQRESVGSGIPSYDRRFSSSARRPSVAVAGRAVAEQPAAPVVQAFPSEPDKAPQVPNEKDSRTQSVPEPTGNHQQEEAVSGAAVQGDAEGAKGTTESARQDSRAKEKPSPGRQAKVADKPLTGMPAENAAPTTSTSDGAAGADKKPSDKEETTWIMSGASNLADQTRDEAGVTSAENTTSRGARRNKKKSKKRGTPGDSALGSPSTMADISSKKKRKLRRGKAEGTGEGIVGSGLSSPPEEEPGGTFVPPYLRRRSSTKSKQSHKSGKSLDSKSACASPPAGWTTHDPHAAVTSAGVAADADAFSPELSDLGELSAVREPPTPPVPNLDIFSREPSPHVASTPSGPPGDEPPKSCSEAPTPMKPNLDIFSLERSPYVPATPKSIHTPPCQPPNAPS